MFTLQRSLANVQWNFSNGQTPGARLRRASLGKQFSGGERACEPPLVNEPPEPPHA